MIHFSGLNGRLGGRNMSEWLSNDRRYYRGGSMMAQTLLSGRRFRVLIAVGEADR